MTQNDRFFLNKQTKTIGKEGNAKCTKQTKQTHYFDFNPK